MRCTQRSVRRRHLRFTGFQTGLNLSLAMRANISRPGRVFAATIALAAGVTASCGVDGLYHPGVISGGEALDRLANASYAGYSLCLQRLQPSAVSNPETVTLLIASRDYQRGYLKTLFQIDEGRGYKEADVDSCATQIVNGQSFAASCDPIPPRCFIAPVDRYTGN